VRLLPLLLCACYAEWGGRPNPDDGVPTPDDDSAVAADDDSVGDDDTTATIDGDGDGVPFPGDCDDADPDVAPGAPELCNGQDDDCDGEVDEGLLVPRWHDIDGDGYGAVGTEDLRCDGEPGWVVDGGDCDDSSVLVHPGATEDCNTRDDDCDGVADPDPTCPCPVLHWPDLRHPYMFCTTPQPWPDAQALCQLHGYELVTFDSQAELDWTTASAVSIAMDVPWWIGFTDEPAEGAWGWIDGSPPSFINWCPTEPNNGHGGECVATTIENCGMLNWGEGGCWNDYPCACATIYAICEGLSELRPDPPSP
jgi:hypothetical protein